MLKGEGGGAYREQNWEAVLLYYSEPSALKSDLIVFSI